MDEPREECGVFGMYDFSAQENVASTIYYGLLALQHRGQESCGIAVSDTSGPKGRVLSRKGMGLVNENFDEEDLDSLCGDIGVGHVRYSTAGASTIENAQPLVLHYLKGTLAMAHNGNLVNSPELMRELSRTGAIFQTTTDSELIAYEIARARINTGSVEEAVSMAMNRLKGSYSLVIMSPRKLIGARDPFGIRPLCIGKRGKAWFFASESCALDTVGAEFVRDVEPGEIVTISPRFGLHSDRSHCIRNGKTARCVFEYIYFGRADSVIDKVSVYNSRLMAGRFLAKDSPVDADLVIGVPESGSVAALGFSMESGIPYGQGFVKNGYIGRTFIRPQQQSRESAVRVKLNPLRQAVEGKRVVMIDDSIVRGTTSDRIVRMLREAGATEVHMRVSSPPFLYPCYFGTDIPEREQLIAYNRTQEEVRGVIGADSLAYLKMERLGQIVEDLPVCNGCFTGKYPVDPPTEDIRGEYER
jgi:amidophosphoribosyltransferase